MPSGRPGAPDRRRRRAAALVGPAAVDLDAAIGVTAAALGVTLPPAFSGQIARYLDEIERWQQVAGLTAYRTRLARLEHLVLESLMWLPVLPAPAAPLLDLGSGPGVPGLLLKLARPEWEVTLLDATRRRANFLRHVVRALGLTGIEVHWGRAEALGAGPLGGRFRTVTMRAVAAAGTAMALAAPFLALDGHLVVSVGPTGTGPGIRREVVLARPGELSWRRQFLIIRRTAQEANVPRGTGRAGAVSHHRGGEPEGRRREDHDGR